MDKKLNDISKPSFLKRMLITGEFSRFIVYMIVALSGILFFILAILSIPQVGIVKPLVVGDIILGTSVDYIVLAIIVSTGMFGIYSFLREKKIHKIDKRFPDFVRDLAESRRAGMTFTKAIMTASKGRYGILTTEIRKIARQISWGNSVEKALESFAKRVNTKLIRRTVSLIIEASRSGGNVADVLDAASKDARELRFIEAERRAGMLSYVAVVYVGLGVFLMILIILTKQLIPSMLGEGLADMSSAGSAGLNIASKKISQFEVIQAFYYASLTQSFGMGLVAGVFEEGRINAGIKHSFIMLLITWIMFKFIITGI